MAGIEKVILAALIGFTLMGVVTRALRVAVGVVLVSVSVLWVMKNSETTLRAVLQVQTWVQDMLGRMLAGGGQQAAQEMLRRVVGSN